MKRIELLPQNHEKQNPANNCNKFVNKNKPTYTYINKIDIFIPGE